MRRPRYVALPPTSSGPCGASFRYGRSLTGLGAVLRNKRAMINLSPYMPNAAYVSNKTKMFVAVRFLLILRYMAIKGNHFKNLGNPKENTIFHIK